MDNNRITYKLKRKLEYEEEEGSINYKPLHFLRCHSRNNDPADIRTQVWHCCFEPHPEDPERTTERFATCGGNSVCVVNARTGAVEAKYSAPDLREMFYMAAWALLGPDTSVVVVGGARGTLHILHPDKGVALLEQRVVTSSQVNVSSLLFHAEHLFCGLSDGHVLVWQLHGFGKQLELVLSLDARSEIFSLAFATAEHMLLAATNDRLRAWPMSRSVLQERPSSVPLYKFRFPSKSCDMQLVDSVEVSTNGVIATKCALHGAIYLWDLPAAMAAKQETVVPSYTLQWSKTDNYFMGIGTHPVSRLLACGDDRGAIWIYDLEKVTGGKSDPAAVLEWPLLHDTHVDHKRKLRLGVYDIVIDKVAVSWNGKYLVAVTNNNMVCVWRRA